MESQDLDYKEARAALAALMESAGLTIAAEFVPLSKSRNASEKSPTLNWRVTLSKGGRPVYTGDYSAGCAHCPGYKTATYAKREGREVVARECETGRPHIWRDEFRAAVRISGGLPIMPDSVDVFSSLVMDSDAIDYATYEDFAGDFGYDPDSRKGESVYRACLEIALKLRAAMGDSLLAKARDLARQM